MSFTRQEIVLAVMAAGRGPFTLAQVQKLLFLIDQEAGLTGGMLARGNFPTHHSWLFDGSAHAMLETLAKAGLVVGHATFARSFMLTSSGHDQAVTILNASGPKANEYFERCSTLIRSVSLSGLASISRKVHPEVR